MTIILKLAILFCLLHPDNMHRTAKQIHTAIHKAENIMLIPHRNPDGDALGSVSAFMQYLRQIDKNHAAYCATESTPRLKFLPHTDYITTDHSVWEAIKPDLVIVFDSGDLRHAGVDEHINNLRNKPVIVNIDHHISNEFYGHHNLVIPTASSTTEVLYHFFKHNEITIDSAMATCLLTGLITDTDNFTNGATSIKSMAIASELIHRGGNAELIRGWVFKDKSIPALKLWGLVLSRLDKHDDLDLVHTYLTQKDLAKYNVTDDEADGIANFMNVLGDGRAALILKEMPDGQVKGSFRTTHDETDVSVWAKNLGGGGHKKAAGFTLEGPVDEALKKVFAAIESLNKNQSLM